MLKLRTRRLISKTSFFVFVNAIPWIVYWASGQPFETGLAFGRVVAVSMGFLVASLLLVGYWPVVTGETKK